MEVKTIKVSLKNWKRLMKWKTEFECKNLDEIIERILNIVPANEITFKPKGSKKEVS